MDAGGVYREGRFQKMCRPPGGIECPRRLLWALLLLVVLSASAAESVDANVTELSPLADPAVMSHTRCNGTGNYFRCSPLECVPVNLTCDGVPHCSNSADEAVPLCGCLSNEFSCGDSCIDLLKRCDTFDDCSDARDEQQCELYSCPHTHMTCANHKCVPHDVICDFVDDCGDGSDELHCNRRKCWFGEFKCNSGQCVRPAAICDGRRDCHDGSDEANCTEADFVTCGNGGRVHRGYWCDGWPECGDNHADEARCGPCGTHQFRCPNGRCIRSSAVCDGVCDCAGSCDDEHRPECRDKYHTVNGVVQCNRRRTWPCVSGLGELHCVGSEYICDGSVDCPADQRTHMSDEQGCRE
ncbi:G-protein coupled receptor GRL101-like [Amphibalanus amphitrite]|uniref:G-protein coupled receptor GRL101-like n=1 Tax=Amphibalanus amphitrite TaxID=1232801 RepID=UPI001C911C2F|nr:G-protein coupled receptor GRL101-like [Amphibalanus amphitrite]